MKALITGNKEYGLAASIANVIPNNKCVSRSTGYNLDNPSDFDNVANESLCYDTFICCSALSNFNQIKLLQAVYQSWVKNEKPGKIVVIGSAADKWVKGNDWIYPIEKKALRSYCQNLSLKLQDDGSDIHITYISPGYLDTPNTREKGVNYGLDCDYVAAIVKWVLEQPSNINISELCLDPVQ